MPFRPPAPSSPWVATCLGGLVALSLAGVTRTGAVTSRAISVGSDVPSVAVQALEGGQAASLNDVVGGGGVVLLNVWATWCPPCRQEMPSMARLAALVEDPDFAIVTVSVDNLVVTPVGRVADFLSAVGLSSNAFVASTGLARSVLAPRGLPSSYLVGRDGRIAKMVIGPTEWDQAGHLRTIRDLLSSDGSEGP